MFLLSPEFCFFVFFFLFFFRFFLFMRNTERQTQAEGEAGSMQGARRGTQSRVSRITPWAEGGRSTAEPPGRPNHKCVLINKQMDSGFREIWIRTPALPFTSSTWSKYPLWDSVSSSVRFRP